MFLASSVHRPHNPTLQLPSAQSIAVGRLDNFQIWQHSFAYPLGRLQLSFALASDIVTLDVMVATRYYPL